VGERLATAAMGVAFGGEGAYTGPTLSGCTATYVNHATSRIHLRDHGKSRFREMWSAESGRLKRCLLACLLVCVGPIRSRCVSTAASCEEGRWASRRTMGRRHSALSACWSMSVREPNPSCSFCQPLPACLCVSLSVCLSVRLSACLPVCASAVSVPSLLPCCL
jgi:hypothetical protein